MTITMDEVSVQNFTEGMSWMGNIVSDSGIIMAGIGCGKRDQHMRRLPGFANQRWRERTGVVRKHSKVLPSQRRFCRLLMAALLTPQRTTRKSMESRSLSILGLEPHFRIDK